MKTGQIYTIKPKYYDEYLGVKIRLLEKIDDSWWKIEIITKNHQTLYEKIEEESIKECYEEW